MPQHRLLIFDALRLKALLMFVKSQNHSWLLRCTFFFVPIMRALELGSIAANESSRKTDRVMGYPPY